MAEYEAGTAFVQFVGSFEGMVREATAEAARDGKAFVAAFNAEVQKGMRGLDLGPSSPESLKDGTEAGSKYADGFKARVKAAGPARIKVDADTTAANAQLDKLAAKSQATGNQMRTSIWGVLAAIAPATLPLVATTGGALAGLIPVTATVAAGVKGISDEMKDGSLAGTKYAKDLASIKSEGQQLEQLAAGGLLAGIDKGLADSHGLFAEVNRDVAVMSGEIGDIIGGAGPALLKILTDLNPLFNTFGGAVDRGAQRLENWATSSDGIEHFVAYVQAELPDVETLFGELIGLIGNLAQGAAPFGGALLHDIDMFVGAIDKIPVGVLQTAIPLAVSLYVALKAYAGLTAIMNGASSATARLGKAWAALDAPAIATVARQQAASAALTAAIAEESVSVARSKAAEAEAYAAMVAESENANATMIAESANAAAAAQAQAAITEEAYAQIAASAAAAAEASATAGETATVSWSAILGPIGAVVIGGGLLATMFLHSGRSAQEAAAQVNTYTDAIKADSGALGENTRQAAINALQKAGALEDARKLGLSLSDVTDAALGNKQMLDAITRSLGLMSFGTVGATKDTHDQVAAARGLLAALGDQNSEVQAAVQNYKDQQAAMGATTGAAKSQEAALDALNTVLGTTVSNLLSAAQSEDQFLEAVKNVTSSVHQNGTSLSQNTRKGLANRDALLSAMQAALSYRDAQEKSGVSTKRANLTLADNVHELEQSAIHAGLSKDAVLKLVRQMGLVPKDIRTKFTVDSAAANANIRFIKQQLADLPNYKTVTVDVKTRGSLQSTRSSQVPGRASGGGLPEGLAWVGERGPELADKHGPRVDIIPNGPAMAFAAAAGLNVPGYAGGTMPPMPVGALIKSGGFGFLWIEKLDEAGKRLVATVLSVGRSVARVAAESQQFVSKQIAAAVAPQITSVTGLRGELGRDTSRATSDRERLEIARQNLHLLNQHAAALKKDAKGMADQASAMQSSTKAERDAKDAAEAQAKAAQKVADAAGKMATRGKAAYEKLKEAADSASRKAQQDAQALVAAVQSEFDTLKQNIADFESGIQQGLTGGSDLSSIWQNLTGNVDSAKQALDSAQQAVQQAVPNAAAFAQAQSDQAAASSALAAAYAQLQAAQSSGDQAAITAAQQAQSAAAQKLATAQAAVAANTPTPDELQAQAQAQQQLTAAQQAYSQAVQQASAGGVADVLAQFAASEQQFADHLTQLQKDGAGQALIDQLASMGAAGGDALAQGLINDPQALASINKSMGSIQSIADSEGAKLAKGFYGSGVKSMQQLLKGIEKQFPDLKKALAPLAAELAAMFVITPTVAGTGDQGGKASGSKTVTIDHIHQLQTVAAMYGVTMAQLIAANPSLKGDGATSAVRKGTKLKIPQFASGVENFDGGLAYVHKNELLVNLSKGTSVYPQITPASSLPAAAFASGSYSGDTTVQVFIGDEAIDPRMVRIVQQTNVNWARGGQHVQTGKGDALGALLSPHALSVMRP